MNWLRLVDIISSISYQSMVSVRIVGLFTNLENVKVVVSVKYVLIIEITVTSKPRREHITPILVFSTRVQ